LTSVAAARSAVANKPMVMIYPLDEVFIANHGFNDPQSGRQIFQLRSSSGAIDSADYRLTPRATPSAIHARRITILRALKRHE